MRNVFIALLPLLLSPASSAAAELVLRGRVADASGRPLARAGVELRPMLDAYRGPYTVTLEPRTELRVRVPALAGSVAQVTLEITDAAGLPFTPARVGMPVERWTMVGGALDLPFLPPGTWTLRVEGPAGEVWRGVAATQVGQPAAVKLR